MYPRDVAKEFCVELGAYCNGISCANDALCTVRAGRDLVRRNPSDVSYVKEAQCPSVSSSSPSGCLDETTPDAGEAASNLVEFEAAVVVLAHSRASELRGCLGSLLDQIDSGLFRFFVSLDSKPDVPAMRAVVEEVARSHGVDIGVWEVEPRVPDVKKHNADQVKWIENFNAGKIAHHYWVALERAFMEHTFKYAIFVEEDLIFSPDFFAFFRSTAWLFEHDSTIMCVSAWNDISFVTTASDACRLLRTTYFPGLGFMLPRTAWLRLREQWPTTPTMGWDYWMRVAMRREGQACIIPEISRSHHVSEEGSSINKASQLKLLKMMAFAAIPNSCGSSGPCRQFGDISYLVESTFDNWLRRTIDGAPQASIDQAHAKPHGQSHLRAGTLYVVPYLREKFVSAREKIGFMPKGTKNAIPSDIRAEHYGLMHTKHESTRAHLLFVDQRSPGNYLKPGLQIERNPNMQSVAAKQGDDCQTACSTRNMQCHQDQMHFLNTCKELEAQFGCPEGCAHQVGKELPVFVPDVTQPSHGQCLITFISALSCMGKHKSTSRLCACLPAQGGQLFA